MKTAFEAWEEAGRPNTFVSFRDGYEAAQKQIQFHEPFGVVVETPEGESFFTKSLESIGNAWKTTEVYKKTSHIAEIASYHKFIRDALGLTDSAPYRFDYYAQVINDRTYELDEETIESIAEKHFVCEVGSGASNITFNYEEFAHEIASKCTRLDTPEIDVDVMSTDFYPPPANASRKQLVELIGRMNFKIENLLEENKNLANRVHNQRETLRHLQNKEKDVEPIGEWVKSKLGDYPTLKWSKDYVAEIGGKLYAQPFQDNIKYVGELRASDISKVIKNILGCADVKNGDNSLVTSLAFLFHKHSKRKVKAHSAITITDMRNAYVEKYGSEKDWLKLYGSYFVEGYKAGYKKGRIDE